ncbi:chordin-like protein 1 isoform X2 [Lytechinus variegatus]|uniref:chordin-like protein 1 isoform X2 n=1 Tax=Lytechinus variegatus TaxID=7654 RepID=UPI001BB1712A|nr:chordin-like protein 1 isoform X2 [Lytechinus variegatus]
MADRIMNIGVFWILATVTLSVAGPTETGECPFGGRTYRLGESWHPYLIPTGIDPCTTCTCIEHDHVTCTREECPRPTCSSPRRIPGQCCLICPDPETITEAPLVAPVEEEAPRYPGCEYKGKTLQHGDLFSVDDLFTSRREDQCAQCGCTLGRIYCALKTCLPLSCPEAEQVVYSDSCCPVCVFEACESNGKTYQSGETWHPILFPFGRVDCILCQCQDGETTCNRISCPSDEELPCRNPQYVSNQCCKVCPDTSEVEPTPIPSACLKGRESTLLYRYQPELVIGTDHTQTFMYALENVVTNQVEIRKWTFSEGQISNFVIEEVSSERFQRALSENREGRFHLSGATTLRKVQKLRKKEARLERRCAVRCVKQALKLPRSLSAREIEMSRDCDVRTRSQSRPRRDEHILR